MRISGGSSLILLRKDVRMGYAPRERGELCSKIGSNLKRQISSYAEHAVIIDSPLQNGIWKSLELLVPWLWLVIARHVRLVGYRPTKGTRIEYEPIHAGV